jgi:hypothetical protein
VRIAREIAAGIAYLHAAVGWVHKGLHSKKIMLCKFPGHARSSLGNTAIFGFSFSRRSAVTARSFDPGIDQTWENEIYLHPTRQSKMMDTMEGSSALVLSGQIDKAGDILRFETLHDVYSLGVVLLEIGLWQDLGQAIEGLEQASAEERKEKLLKATKQHLPKLMGDKFTRIVRHCLQVTDKADMTAAQVLECLEELVL